MKRIAVFVSGSGSNLQALLDAQDLGGKVVLVLSSNDKAYAITRAQNANIPTVVCKNSDYKQPTQFQNAILNYLGQAQIDLIVLAGYLNILGKEVIDKYPNQMINVHPSLIPSFCGKGFYGTHVHQAAIDYGVKISGATVHFVDEKADTGAIIFQESVPVQQDDTATQLQERILAVEHRLLIRAVQLFCCDKLCVQGRKVSVLL